MNTGSHATSRQPLTLAVQQHAPTPGDIDKSVARLCMAAEQANAQGAHLLVVPEASITGYNIALDTAKSIALHRDSSSTDAIKDLCRKKNIAIAFGYIEREGDDLFNAVQLIDASGKRVAHYRKTHLWGDLDRKLFQAGDSFTPVFEFNGWHIGLLICYDIEFPESVRHLALSGCDLVLAPTALMSPWRFVAKHVTRVRAAENQVYLAYANYCGTENGTDYVGHSCIVAPDGSDLARAGNDPALLVATLTHEAIAVARRDVPYLRDRRPELYRAP